jgi:MinD-like ATPase involved in chromosome partitioning or flagellar assembly
MPKLQRWSRLRASIKRYRLLALPAATENGSGLATAISLPPRGQPAVIVVGGGRGGSGRTTLAVEIATALAANSRGVAPRVLLIDADPVHSDLDIKMGAAGLDSDRCPGARVDRVLLQLQELADRRVHIDSVLWVHPGSGVRALLAPERAAEIGREHLDYLYTYILAPAFDAIVVDAGPTVPVPARQSSGPAAFWLTMADSVVVPLRPTLSDARSAVQALRAFDRLGVPRQRCRLLMGVGSAESSSAAMCERWLSEFVVVRWPWAPEVAYRAGVAQRSLADCDRRIRQTVASLLPDLVASRRTRS